MKREDEVVGHSIIGIIKIILSKSKITFVILTLLITVCLKSPLFVEICRGTESQFGELKFSLSHSGHRDLLIFKNNFFTLLFLSVDLLGPDGVELNHDDNDRVEGRDEHEDEVENDKKLKDLKTSNKIEMVINNSTNLDIG